MSRIDHPSVRDIFGALQIADVQKIGNFDVSGDWTPLNDDAGVLGNSNNHILGKKSLEFDKLAGATGGVVAVVYSDIEPIDLRRFLYDARLRSAVHLTDLTDLVDVFIRLGSSAVNYNQWTFLKADLIVDTWSMLDKKLSEVDVSVGGTGLDFANLVRVEVGATFNAQANTLANMQWDGLHIGY